MKYLKMIVSCLIGCAASALPAQTYLGTIYQGFSSSVDIPITIYTTGTLGKVLVVTGGATDLDFTYTGSGSCKVGSPVTAGTHCTIGVKFAPTMAGARYGAYLLTNQDGSVTGGGYLLGNGTGPQMSFGPGVKTQVGSGYYAPAGLAVDEAGNLFAEEGTLGAGESAAAGYVLKNAVPFGSASWNSSPNGIAIDGGGLLYTSTTSGSYMLMPPTMDPTAVPFQGHAAVDAWGNLFSACTTGLCKETLQEDGSYVESTIASGLTPAGIAVDGNGNVLVAAGALYKFSPVGSSYTQMTLRAATLGAVSVAVDGPGNIYVGDASGNVYKETLYHNGNYGHSTLLTGVYPGLLAASTAGDLYYFQAAGKDSQGKMTYSIFKQDYSHAPTIKFADTVKGALNSDGVKTITITNSGSLPLQFSGITFPENFIEASQGAGECKATTVLPMTASCTLKIRFAPTAEVTDGDSIHYAESIVITSNNGNQPGSETKINLVATELAHVAAPTLSLPGGVYYSEQTVTASTTTPGAVLYYTLNGSTPTTSSRRVNGPIAIRGAYTLKVIAVVPGVETSAVTSAYYALTAPTPVITAIGAPVNGTQMVMITTPAPFHAIYYTTAGNKPTTSSTIYSQPFAVSTSKYVMAFASQTGFIPSPIVKMKFNLQPAASPK